MGHHRFKAIIEVIMKEPGNTNMDEPDPAPADLTSSLTDEIRSKAGPKKKKGNTTQQYEIEQVIGWTRS